MTKPAVLPRQRQAAACHSLIMKNSNLTIVALALISAACANSAGRHNQSPAPSKGEYTRENPYIPHGYNDHFGSFTDEKRQDYLRCSTDTDFFRTGQRHVK